jgi:hypothetical protein
MDNAPLLVAVTAIAADPRLRRALLEPSLATLGKFPKAWLKVFLARLHPGQRDNLLDHTDAAAAAFGMEALEEMVSKAEFEDWALGVSRVDPGDKDLAAIWLAAFEALRRKGPERVALLAIAQQMRPDEAQVFEQLIRSRQKPDGSFPVPPAPLWRWLRDILVPLSKRPDQVREQLYLKRFVELGLAHAISVRLSSSGAWKLTATLAVVLSGAWAFSHLVWGASGSRVEEIFFKLLAIASVSSLFATLVFIVRVFVNAPELTPHGAALARQILQLKAATEKTAASKPKKAKASKKPAPRAQR